MVKVMSLLIKLKAGGGLGAWTEMEIWCVKGAYGKAGNGNEMETGNGN